MNHFATTLLHLRCPRCGEGALYSRGFKLHEFCPVCTARYDRHGGAWTGSVVMGYTVAGVVGLALWLTLWVKNWDFTYAEYVAPVVGCTVAMLVYRNLKAWWMWILYGAGFVYPDDQEGLLSGPKPWSAAERAARSAERP
jgi:uncharacterized protein (DUF983 family)